MDNRKIARTPLAARYQNPARHRIRKYCCAAVFLFLMALIPIRRAQMQQPKPAGAAPNPEPAVPAILAAFDKYEVVAMPQGHGMQDLNDFILSLIRNPAFSEKVNDIEFECGNSLYQPILDRYIAGEDVQFTEVQKVWRKMASPPAERRDSLSNFSLSCTPSIRSSQREGTCGSWLAILPLIGIKSKALTTS